ncbi:MAG: flagellin lysine-N-methylase [Clostridia bacterium]|nr:flagellin lysine-N-methylase [Clostridia bacterium]
MKLIAPDYYNSFSCIASACRHSCCVGWDIAVDEDTYEYYKTVGGALGKKLKKSISVTDEGACFAVDENLHCPFLQADGLCEIICNLGEGALCNICADHPRFRNYFADRTEIGLGLSCEAAAKLVLSKKEKTELIVLEDDGVNEQADEEETALLKFTDNLFAIAQDREFTVEERTENLCDFCGFDLPDMSFAKWAEFYSSLERLDKEWEEKLILLKSTNHFFIETEFQTAFEQLLVYFLYRHMPLALYDGDVVSKVGFAIISVKIIAAIFSQLECKSIDTLADLARMYSAEIEYSDENPERIFEII